MFSSCYCEVERISIISPLTALDTTRLPIFIKWQAAHFCPLERVDPAWTTVNAIKSHLTFVIIFIMCIELFEFVILYSCPWNLVSHGIMYYLFLNIWWGVEQWVFSKNDWALCMGIISFWEFLCLQRVRYCPLGRMRSYFTHQPFNFFLIYILRFVWVGTMEQHFSRTRETELLKWNWLELRPSFKSGVLLQSTSSYWGISVATYLATYRW